MSVINKMLRDLDNRQPAGSSGAAGGLTSGTISLGARQTAPTSHRSPRHGWRAAHLAIVVAAAAALVFGWWVMRPEMAGSGPGTAPVPLVGEASTSPLLASREKPTARATVSPGNSVALQQEVLTQAVSRDNSSLSDSAVSSNSALKETLEITFFKGLAKAPAASGHTLAANESERAPVALKALPKAPLPLTAPGVAVEAAVVPRTQSVMLPAAIVTSAALAVVLKPARQAAMEALAHAQAQWNEGSHLVAIELLNGAIMRMDLMPVVDTVTLAALTRELVRMMLAQGQPGEALVLLERLEHRLDGVADIWALRGNAAQRLGRHPEATNAYLKGLALSPNESRWMLGAAVSLAAQGHTVTAGELAERARVAGALRPDVANYLRQLGVVIRSE